MNSNFKNFKKGDYITVLQGQMLNPMMGMFIGHGLSEEELKTPRYDNSYKGDVLEIMAMDYPYIVLKNKSGGDSIIDLDLRRVVFKKLTDKYVAARLTPPSSSKGLD